MERVNAAQAAKDSHAHKVLVDAPQIDEMIADLDRAIDRFESLHISCGTLRSVRSALRDIKERDQAKHAGMPKSFFDECVAAVEGERRKPSMVRTIGEISTRFKPHGLPDLQAKRLRREAEKAISGGQKLKGVLLHLDAYLIDGRLDLELADPEPGTDPEGDAVAALRKRDAAHGDTVLPRELVDDVISTLETAEGFAAHSHDTTKDDIIAFTAGVVGERFTEVRKRLVSASDADERKRD